MGARRMAAHSLSIQDIEQALFEAAELALKTDAELQPWVKSYFKHHSARLVQDLQFCVSLAAPHSRLLDVGCAPFLATIALQKLGYDVVGVDLAPQRFAELLNASRLKVLQCNVETEPLAFADDHFDLVLFSEVFEHLRMDLISTVTEIRRILKPGGYLLCSSPNLLEFRKMLLLLTRGKTSDIFDEYRKLHTLGHMGHVREYTARDVREFMIKMGFGCEETIYLGIADWRLRPFGLRRLPGLARSAFHRLLPASRSRFMLVLVKK